MSITLKVLNEVKNTIQKHNMFNYNDTVVIGVSGGADSVMLLHCLNSIKEEYNIELLVAHVNHKIRKDTAERDALFVESLCKKLGIKFYLREVPIPELAKEYGLTEEEMGRKVRYDFFSELAGEEGKIATAHNANDNVETVLMRFMRGTGIKGMSGIPYVRDNIVRPILNVSREDIERYIEENSLTHITDETNLESIYTRNKNRLELIPFMKEHFNPNLINTVNNNIISYKEDSDYFETETNQLFDKHAKRENFMIFLPLQVLRDNHPSISKRLILKTSMIFLNDIQTNLSADMVEKIYQNLDSKVGTTFVINKELQVRVGYEDLIFENLLEKQNFNEEVYSYNFGEDISLFLKEFEMKLNFSVVENSNIVNKPFEFYLPLEEYKDKILEIRTRQDGDIFRVEDNVHKKLNKMFVDKKIDKNIRDNIPLLCNGKEVLCAFGYFVTRYNKREGKFVKVEKR